MPRPKKCRHVCSLPASHSFGALDASRDKLVNMSIDEYECIRLIDLEGLTQLECAKQMNVARTTVQSIYLNARKKLAECLVECATLHISGGDFKLCKKGGCGKTCRKKRIENDKNSCS